MNAHSTTRCAVSDFVLRELERNLVVPLLPCPSPKVCSHICFFPALSAETLRTTLIAIITALEYILVEIEEERDFDDELEDIVDVWSD